MFSTFSTLTEQKIPSFFYTDFEGNHLFCTPLDQLHTYDIEFQFHGDKSSHNFPHKPLIEPVSYASYKSKFEKVQENLLDGNTYLLNLTQPTKLETSLSLKEIYTQAHAPYKVRVGNLFVCFSPEAFITIENNTIHTYPMKGTIDSAIPDAKNVILNDPKEHAEHTMIVDLLRNDLGRVAKNISVEKFRYLTTINTGTKLLYQVSSHICGTLDESWKSRAGEILKELLPAGSISGTPKRKTVELIKEIEAYERGFFTGIFGYFDGENLYSAVSIRYIEKNGSEFWYKSGGGITSDSVCENEYQEMLDKIYIP